MHRLVSIIVLAAAAAWPAMSAAQAQPAPPRNPNILVDYIEPRPPIDPQDKD